jgi:predicted DNA-binding transcriptional regulator
MLLNKKEVSGNTLRVYMFLVKNGPSELREVQRALGFSTASLASYHLNKLAEIGYVFQDNYGKYVAKTEAAKEILEGYTKVGKILVPQLLFFSVFFSILIVYLSLQSIVSQIYLPFLIVASLSCIAVLWYETLRLWRRLPAQ